MKKTIVSLFLAAIIASPLAAFGNVATVRAASINTAIRGTTNSTVYWYANDGKRYVFPNTATYYTWFTSFSNVQTISDSELFSIQLGGNVTYRPGAKLVKVTTDPKVYAVARGGILRHVTSESLAIQLYGSNWASKVQDVPDEFFTNYSVGNPIYSTSDYNVSNEYNGVFSPSDSLRTQGQNNNGSQNSSLTLTADRTSITSDQSVYLTGTYFGSLPSGGYLEIKDVRNSNTIKTCTNTSTCNVTVYPTVDSSQNTVQYYIVAKNSNGTHIGTQYGPVIYTNGSSQTGTLTLTADRTSITSGQSVTLNANYNGNVSSERIIIEEIRTGAIVKTCYFTTSCAVTVYPYQNGYSSTQYSASVLVSLQSLVATQYSPVIYFNGTNQNGTLTLTYDRTNITSGQAVILTSDYNANLPSGGRIEIKEVRTNSIVKTCYNSSSCTVTVYPYVWGFTSTQYVSTVFNNSGTQVATQLGPVIYFDGIAANGTLTFADGGSNPIVAGEAVLLSGSFWIGDTNVVGEYLEIKDVRDNSTLKTCYDTTNCTVTVYPTPVAGQNTAQYYIVAKYSTGVVIATKYGSVKTFYDQTMTGLLTLSANRTSISSGESVVLNATYSPTLPANGRIEIQEITQSYPYRQGTHSAIVRVVQTCYTNTCQATVNPTATTMYRVVAFNQSGNYIPFGQEYVGNTPNTDANTLRTITVNATNNGSTNDGVNYINGLTLQTDRTSINNGDMVKLTANAYNAGNWSYIGNRIEIRDIRTGSIVRTCYDQSWCVADVSVQGNNGTAQYEARIYDRNGNFVMSQFGPVIYVNGTTSTSTGSAGNTQQVPNTDIYIAPSTNVRAGGTVYITASFTNLPFTSTDTVIRIYTEQSSSPIGTCSASVSCSVPYTISNSGVNTRVYGVASNSSLSNTRETARIPLVSF